MVASVLLPLRVFMRAHVEALSAQYNITLVANGAADEAYCFGSGVTFTPLRIERRISIGADLRAFIALWRLFRREKFDCVHSITPKAGLLSMCAARLARVPLRFHTFTGQVWATKTGFERFVLKSLDRLLASSATTVLADSASQRGFLAENRVADASSIVVLGDGSVSGVDVKRFARNPASRDAIRTAHRIPDSAVVFLYLGRLTRDKGVADLARAFASCAPRMTNIHLLVVGPDEDDTGNEVLARADEFPGRVHLVGFADRPEDYMSAADVFCLPSYREGFGTSIIEAAAAGLPAVASRIYGIVDAVNDGVTGILHRPAVDSEIADAIVRLASNERLRLRMGEAAHARVIADFPVERLTRELSAFYRAQFAHAGIGSQ